MVALLIQESAFWWFCKKTSVHQIGIPVTEITRLIVITALLFYPDFEFHYSVSWKLYYQLETYYQCSRMPLYLKIQYNLQGQVQQSMCLWALTKIPYNTNFGKRSGAPLSWRCLWFSYIAWIKWCFTMWLLGWAQKELHISIIIVNYNLWTCPNIKLYFLSNTFTIWNWCLPHVKFSLIM